MSTMLCRQIKEHSYGRKGPYKRTLKMLLAQGNMTAILRLLAALCLATTACTDGFQTGVKRVQSFRTKLIREGKHSVTT